MSGQAIISTIWSLTGWNVGCGMAAVHTPSIPHSRPSKC